MTKTRFQLLAATLLGIIAGAALGAAAYWNHWLG